MAIAEIRPQLASRVAARYEVPRTYADHCDMLSAETGRQLVALGGQHVIAYHKRSDPAVLPPLDVDPPDVDLDEGTAAEYESLVNFYIHQINLMRHLMGESYRITFADRHGVLLATESESGIVGAIEMSPYRTSIDWQERILVAFERGYLEIDLSVHTTRGP